MKRVVIILVILLGFTNIIWFFPSDPPFEMVNSVNSEIKKHHDEFQRPAYAVLIDYNKSVFRKRLWVIEVKSGKVVMNGHVSHAWKSGFFFARKFSNSPGSELSCIGTFKTMEKYKSNYGYGKYQVAMRIKGLNKGTNDNAYLRNIVFHSYMLPFWSKGCFMTFPGANKRIVQLASNGSIVIVRH